jgi:hypothetical protein
MDKRLKDALFGCTPENHPNRALRGIYTCDDFIVASDSTVFVKVNRPFDMDESLVDRNGNPIAERYPNIKDCIIPDPVTPEIVISASELKRAAELIPKSPDEIRKRIALNLCGACLYPPRVLAVLRVFEALEDESLSIMSYNDRVVLRGNRVVAVIMTIGLRGDTPPLIENYTVESINLMADLL